jgi:hypothetical protein
MTISQQWITTQDFLTRRMVGITRFGESGLTFQAVEE